MRCLHADTPRATLDYDAAIFSLAMPPPRDDFCFRFAAEPMFQTISRDTQHARSYTRERAAPLRYARCHAYNERCCRGAAVDAAMRDARALLKRAR